jgi:hypothetical protein
MDSILSHAALLSTTSYEKCEYELYIERVKEFAKLRKQQLLVSIVRPCRVCCSPSNAAFAGASRQITPPPRHCTYATFVSFLPAVVAVNVPRTAASHALASICIY